MKPLASFVAFLAGNDDLADVLVVEIADRALDQAAFLVDEAGGRGVERQRADVLPKTHQVFEVALDLDLGAVRTGRAQDDAHALRHFEAARDFLQALAVLQVGDLAGDPATTRGVRHQHRVATGERQVCRQRRAFVAALFLGDLNEQDLAALDDFLDAVLLAGLADLTVRNLFHGVFGTDRFDDFLFAVVAVVIVVVVVVAATAVDVLGDGVGVDHGGHFAAVAFVAVDGSGCRFFRGLCLGLARALRLCLRLFRRCFFFDHRFGDSGFCRLRLDIGLRYDREIDGNGQFACRRRCGFDMFDVVVAPRFFSFGLQQCLAVGKGIW